MRIHHKSLLLQFKSPSGTSRGVLTEKITYILNLQKEQQSFLGETGFFKGLSHDDRPNYEEKLNEVCTYFDFNDPIWWEKLRDYPSIQFGLEQILKAAENPHNDQAFSPILFPSEFTQKQKGIPINGLIWMGNIDFMKQQINEKIQQKFRCIKLKIGVNWSEEKALLKKLRQEFPVDRLELRVDANGAFGFEEAKKVLEELALLNIHSIEQPIKAGQIQQMAELCQNTPTPIALDEELIGVVEKTDKLNLLQMIQPQYIILKPSLVGGWQGSQEWIEAAKNQQIGYWITSALESNIGLNAIAQWTFTRNNPLPQGLGTGGLFVNNFDSRLKVIDDQLFFI